MAASSHEHDNEGTPGSRRGNACGEGEPAAALMVSAQARDAWANSWVDEIVRDADGRPSLGACREFADFRGRFGKVFG